MKNYTATAMALALVAGVVGLAFAPVAAASNGNCDGDFPIAGLNRNLAAGQSEVGETEVLMLAGDQRLTIQLVDAGNGGELTWTVFHKPSTQCVQYSDGGCDEDNVLATETTVSCVLDAPASGSKTYWVLFEETSDADDIVYKASVAAV